MILVRLRIQMAGLAVIVVGPLLTLNRQSYGLSMVTCERQSARFENRFCLYERVEKSPGEIEIETPVTKMTEIEMPWNQIISNLPNEKPEIEIH